MQAVSDLIISWYHRNKRDLPWRNTKDPYKIWLSEIILQQTRVAQGLPYYEKFTGTYPTVNALAAANEEELLKLWQGLGYYSRARNLHSAAREIKDRFKGKFPESYEDIRALKGIGDYTAAAIASFAFNLPYPVLDGNVFRVIARLNNMSEPVNSGSSKKLFLEIATAMMDRQRPADFNQAMMEFGAMHCTPRNPACDSCPVQHKCQAFASGTVNQLPIKLKKTAAKERYFHYLVAVEGENTYIRKRTADDIWKHLYEFPMIESESLLAEEALLYKLREMSNEAFTFGGIVHEATQQLTHRTIRARFFKIYPRSKKFFTNSDIFEVKIPDLQSKFALPRLMDRFCESHLFSQVNNK